MSNVLRLSQEKGRRAVAAITISALAALGISSCSSETNQVTWMLNATCPEDEAPEVKNVSHRADIGTFEIACGDQAPTSVEVISGPSDRADTNEPTTGDHNIEVEVEDYTDSWSAGDARITAITTEEEMTRVVIKDMESFDRVAVVE